MLTIQPTATASQVYGQLSRTFSFDPAALPAKERGHKELGRPAAAFHLAALLLLLLPGCIWLADGGGARGQCRFAMESFGVVYALTATQLIVAHMAKEPFEPSLWAILCLAAGAANSRLALFDPYVVAASLAGLTTVGYLHYVLSVVNQICGYLGIRCLTITKKKAGN